MQRTSAVTVPGAPSRVMILHRILTGGPVETMVGGASTVELVLSLRPNSLAAARAA
jgi:hypothetical protein